MIKAEIVIEDDEKKVKVEMSGNPIECTSEAICIVVGLYNALKKHPAGEIFADAFCVALRDEVFKGDEELEKAERKAEEQATDEANDFLRKFMDALKR